jgi:hypothetical protein
VQVLIVYVLAGIGVRAYRAVVAGALFGIIAAVVWALLVMPPVVEFGLSVASAMAWCVWLEKHPDVNADHDLHPATHTRGPS